MSELEAVGVHAPVRATSMGEFQERPTRDQITHWLHSRSEGRLCPVCLDLITNKAQTCSWGCYYQWLAIRKNPRLLLEWFVEVAAQEPGVRHVRVWEREQDGDG